MAVAGIAPERVDHLSGDREAARWQVSPASLAATALFGAALLAAIAVLLAVPGASTINLTRVLAQSCLLLIAVGVLTLSLTGTRLRRALKTG